MLIIWQGVDTVLRGSPERVCLSFGRRWIQCLSGRANHVAGVGTVLSHVTYHLAGSGYSAERGHLGGCAYHLAGRG